MWVEIPDPESNVSIIVSRCYVKSNNKNLFPAIVIDVDRDSDEPDGVFATVNRSEKDDCNWQPIAELSDWIVAEKEDLKKRAIEMIKLMGEDI